MCLNWASKSHWEGIFLTDLRCFNLSSDQNRNIVFDVVTLQSFSIVFTIVPWSIYIVFVRLFGVSLEMFQWKPRVFTTVAWMCMSSDKHINDWFPAFISIHIGISWLYKTILAMWILICSVVYSSVIARIFEKGKNHIHIYSDTFCWNHTLCL